MRLERTSEVKILQGTEANLPGQLTICCFLLLEKYIDCAVHLLT